MDREYIDIQLHSVFIGHITDDRAKALEVYRPI